MLSHRVIRPRPVVVALDEFRRASVVPAYVGRRRGRARCAGRTCLSRHTLNRRRVIPAGLAGRPRAACAAAFLRIGFRRATSAARCRAAPSESSSGEGRALCPAQARADGRGAARRPAPARGAGGRPSGGRDGRRLGRAPGGASVRERFAAGDEDMASRRRRARRRVSSMPKRGGERGGPLRVQRVSHQRCARFQEYFSRVPPLRLHRCRRPPQKRVFCPSVLLPLAPVCRSCRRRTGEFEALGK